jgi:DNA-binding beta-propeller fold protein YncE
MTRYLVLTCAVLLAGTAMAAEIQSGPPLPHRLVEDWAKLPAGWNFGECAGVDVDAADNVWVYNRGPRQVVQFDKNGVVLQAWENVPTKSAHGIRIGPEGNVWLVDVNGHAVLKCDRQGRIKMVIVNAGGGPGDNESKYAFNRPTALRFTPDGNAFYVSDGYGNSRVIKYTKDGEYLTHWGSKGTGDGQFDLVHDVCVDSRGTVYVADRTNARVQIFDANGKFIGKWTDIGNPWGLHYVKSEDMIYMADGHANRVVKLNLDGQVKGVLGSFGKAPGKFDFAHHIAVDSTGAIYVVEIKNWRVQKFTVQ